MIINRFYTFVVCEIKRGGGIFRVPRPLNGSEKDGEKRFEKNKKKQKNSLERGLYYTLPPLPGPRSPGRLIITIRTYVQ